MRWWRRVGHAVMVGLALVLLGSGATSAWACSCAGATVAEQADRADLVARGLVISVDRSAVGSSSADPVLYVLRAEHVWKGPAYRDFLVESAAFGASCGLEGIEEGDEIVLFAQAEGPRWTANLCGGTAPGTPDLVASVTAHLGAGTPIPAVTPSPTAPSTPAATTAPASERTGTPWYATALPWAVLGAVVAGGIAVVVMGRRRA